jgi:hypothetical protein
MRISIRSVGSVVVLVGALASHACGGGNADTQPASAAPPASTAPASTTASTDFGVAECDDYFKKLEDCIGKNPALKASMGGDTMKQQKEGWKQMASNPATKDSLKTTCKSAADALAATCK